MRADRTAVEELIYRSLERLDEDDFAGFLDLCLPGFRYRLVTWSPEIKKEMTWLDRDRTEMESFFKMLPLHNSDRSPLTRNATVYRVAFDGDGAQASAVTAFQLYRTALDGGATELLAVGKYHDLVALDGEEPVLVDRTVRLATRDLGWGSHIPF